MNPWSALAGLVAKLLGWLGFTFLVRRGAKDSVRADNAEATVEAVKRASAPLSDGELQRVREKWRRD